MFLKQITLYFNTLRYTKHQRVWFHATRHTPYPTNDTMDQHLPASHPHLRSLTECPGCTAQDTCLKPQEHDTFPSELALDHTSTLFGQMKHWTRHALVTTNTPPSTWPAHVEKATINDLITSGINPTDAQAISLTGTLSRTVRETKAGSWLIGVAYPATPGELLLFPDYQHIVNTSNLDMKQLVQQLSKDQTHSTTTTLPHHATILICAHQQRDRRCGYAGPILYHHFIQALKARGPSAQASVRVLMTSHVGGHKFAGNVIIYPAGIWYGRVTPCHVDAVLEHTVFGNTVLRELYRGHLS
jgi:(2Fe-2S) ferredoxin